MGTAPQSPHPAETQHSGHPCCAHTGYPHSSSKLLELLCACIPPTARKVGLQGCACLGTHTAEGPPPGSTMLEGTAPRALSPNTGCTLGCQGHPDLSGLHSTLSL